MVKRLAHDRSLFFKKLRVRPPRSGTKRNLPASKNKPRKDGELTPFTPAFAVTILSPVVYLLTKIGEGSIWLLKKVLFAAVAMLKKTVVQVKKLKKVLSPNRPFYLELKGQSMQSGLKRKGRLGLGKKLQRLLRKMHPPRIASHGTLFSHLSKQALPTLPALLEKRGKPLTSPWRSFGQRLAPKIIYAIPLRFKLHYFLLGLFVGIVVLTPTIVRIWVAQLPQPNQLAFREIPLTTKIYDRNGKLLFQIYANQNRSNVPLVQIPQNFINATIAIEDKNFYHHYGFDLEAILRAGRETLINKNIQGGSTITQQLIKSALLTPEVSLGRKAKEVFLAFWAERLYTKDQILEMYFNQVPYGGTAWGAEAASELYFRKGIKDIDLAESALLAGLPSGPSLYSPFGQNPQLAKKRQEEVLERMQALGYINQQQAAEAKNEELAFARPTIDIKAPHFVMYVKDLLVQKYGGRMVEQGGLKVVTTLDLTLQNQAQEIVQSEVEKLAGLAVSNAASLITDPQTGEILAMVGSRDYFDVAHDGNVNLTTALRQPGSSIKVVTYAAALEKGMTAASILDDSPITYSFQGGPSYSPVNYDGRFHGRIPLREALANSFNVPAVKTLAQIGVPTMIAMGKRLGITTWDDENRFGLSLTLGGGEIKMIDMASVYGVLATGGIRHEITPFLKITNGSGEILLEKKKDDGHRVLSEGIAFILSDILADNGARALEFGTNSPLVIPNHRVSVKTGTTDIKRDNWTIGFTKDALVAVWVGNNDNTPMNQALTSGITGAAPIWHQLITTLIANKPSDSVQTPTEVIATAVCRNNGLLPCTGCPTRTEYFIQGTQPQYACKPETVTPSPAIGGAEPPGVNSQPQASN